MKIAIIGAAGKEGSLLVKEALERGHEVTAVVRNKNKLTDSKVNVIEKDLFKLVYDDVKDNDVIIDAFGTFNPETLNEHQTSLKHLADMLSGKSNRLLIVGGAGSLYVDPEHKTRLMDTPDFPDAFKPLAGNMGIAFDDLKTRTDVNWTYLSPAADFAFDGKRTGKYKIGAEELLVNSNGVSTISYADYAIAMIDEAENGNHIKARFTVASE